MKPKFTVTQETMLRAAHRLAMEAKGTVFRAQDAMSAAWSSGLADLPRANSGPTLARAIDDRLLRVRAELEALDREVRSAMRMSAPLGSAPKEDP